MLTRLASTFVCRQAVILLAAAAAVLLLAAGCSNGSDDAGRGAVPTTAPAVTATSATDAVAPATTRTTANVTDVPDDSTTPVATVTVTDTTPTGTTTPVTGTTETVTSTTGSGPTVPTTLPTTDDTVDDITDDTTTSTTEADTGDGTEPRNKVDEQYPLGSAERQAYLAVAGGVAPVGATVTFDAGDAEHVVGFGQRGRTTADRWPDGYPAAPRSPDYSSTTFAQREAQRAARWVAAMERGGVYRWWVRNVPTDPDQPTSEIRAAAVEPLRVYQTAERYNDRPPANLIWALPRVDMCTTVASVKTAKHAGTGSETISCEVVLDWALWWVEEFTSPSLISQPWYDRWYTTLYRHAALVMQALPQPPTNPAAVNVAVGTHESGVIFDGGFRDAGGWVLRPDDARTSTGLNADLHAALDVWTHFAREVEAGRRPWEKTP